MNLTTKTEIAGAETTVLTPKYYDILKKIVQVVLPAFITLYLGLAQIWDLSNPEKVAGTAALINTFLGVIVGISGRRYSQSDAGTSGEFVVTEDPGGPVGYRLALNDPPELLADQERITFKVNKVPV